MENSINLFINSISSGEFIQILQSQGLDVKIEINEISMINNDGTSTPIDIIDIIDNDDNDDNDKKIIREDNKDSKNDKKAIIASTTIVGTLLLILIYLKKIKINKIRAEIKSDKIDNISIVP
jgi:hypothetical protein